MQTEAEIQRSIQAGLKRDGAWVVKYHGGPHSAKGIPDLLVCYRGRFFAFEVKRPGKGPTALQEAQIRRIIKAGGIACIVTSLQQAREVINECS